MSSIWSYLRFRDIYELMGRKCHPIVAWNVLRSCQEVSWSWLLTLNCLRPPSYDTMIRWYFYIWRFYYSKVSFFNDQWFNFLLCFTLVWEYLKEAERIDRVPSLADSVLHQDLVWFVMSQISKLCQCCRTPYPPESWTRADQNSTKKAYLDRNTSIG